MSRHFVRRSRWLIALLSCALLAALWQGDAFHGLIAGDSNDGSTSSGFGLTHFGFGHKSAAAAAVPPAYSLTQMWAASPRSAVAIARGDFNGDGRDDLAAVGGDLTSMSSPVELSLYLQQPNGVLGAAITHALPMDVEHFKVLGLEAIDLNEDDRSDLVITIRDNSGMPYLLSQPGGDFVWRLDNWSVLVPSAKAQVADMDGDGHADIFVPLIDPDANFFSGDAGMLATFFSDGHGNFPRHGFELTTEVTKKFALGQLNADLLPDFLSLRNDPNEQRTFLRRNEGGGAFTDAQVLDARWPEEFVEVTAADIHGGARTDTVALARGSGSPRFVVYPQLANGELATQPVQYAAGDYSSHLRHADLDDDGDEDLLQAGQDREKSQFFYYLQDEYGLGYARAVLFDLSGSADQYEMRDMTTGDFNSDGVTDVAVGTMAHGVMVAKGVLTPYTGAGVLPGPPEIGQLTPDSSPDNAFGRVFVAVTAPVDNGGNPITGYSVYSIPGGGRDKNAGSTAGVHEMVGLDNNRSYTFYARASTVAGMGMASALSAPLALGTPPDPGRLPVVRGEDASHGHEPDVGVRMIRVLVSLDGSAPAGGVSVSLTTVDGTAVAGSDYVATGPLSVTVPEGQSYVFVDIPIIVGDMVPEETEMFSFHLSNPQGATIQTPDFEVRVFDNDIDDSPRIVIGSVDLAEGNSGTHVINVPILLNKAQPTDVIFDVEDDSVGYGGAAVGVDIVPYHFVGVRIPAGQTSTTVPITIIGDLEYELDEPVAPYLSNIQGAVEGVSEYFSFIKNDDEPPEIRIADASVLEGNSVGGIARFTVSVAGTLYQDAHFTIASIAGGAKAGSDFQPEYLTGLFIPKGETSVQVEIPVVADDLYELDDTFTVTLQDTDGLPIADGIAVGTIVNDDAPPVFTVSDVNVAEGGNAHFTISLSKAIGMDATFDLSVDPGTAQPGTDYSPPAAQGVMIPEGTTTRTLDVPTVADSAVEMNETFAVNASHIIGAGIVHAQGKGRIVNDDLAGISIADATLVEGNDGNTSAVFEIRLSAPMPTAVSLSVGAVAGGTAQAGVDYLLLTPEVRTIDAGRTRIVFSVPVVGDTTAEGNESFEVTLAGVSGAMVADDTAIGTIINDDGAGVRPKAVKTSGLRPTGDRVFRRIP